MQPSRVGRKSYYIGTGTVTEISMKLGPGHVVEGRGFKDKEGGLQPVVGFKTLLILHFGGCILLIIPHRLGSFCLGTEARH